MVCALTGGSMLLMWLGELITEQGIGNGISLIITVGIVSRLPSTLQSIITTLVGKAHKLVIFGTKMPFTGKTALYTFCIAFFFVALTWMVVMLNEAARRITIHYAKRVQGNRSYGGVTTTYRLS